jgi:hypothetical protein
VDAYSPYPVEELADALGFQQPWIPLTVLIGGIAGAVGGYLLQYYALVVDYPLNVGGRPLHTCSARLFGESRRLNTPTTSRSA